MSKIIIILFTVLVTFSVKAMDTTPPWQIGDRITFGHCSSAGAVCYRIFLGISADNKLLVQDFNSEAISIQEAIEGQANESDDKQDLPLTDPYHLLTIDHAKYTLFHLEDGRDGFYRSYQLDGRLAEEGPYIAGKKEGLWLSLLAYDDKSYGYYHDDEKEGVWISQIGKIIYKSVYEQGKIQQSIRILPNELEQYNKQLQQSLQDNTFDYQRFADFIAIKYIPPEEYLLPCENAPTSCYEQLETIGDELIVIEGKTNLSNRKVGVMNKQQQVIISPQYDRISIQDNYIKVANYGWGDSYNEGLYNLAGEMIIAPKQYYSIDLKTEHQMAIVDNYDDINNIRSFGVIDFAGHQILPVAYRSIHFDNHIIYVNSHFQDGNHIYEGFYNIQTGKYISPRYHQIGRFNNGIAKVGKMIEQQYKYGLIDENGYEVVPPVYDAMYFDKQQQFAEVELNHLFGVINNQGQIMVPIIFERFVNFSVKNDYSNVLIGQNNQGYAVYNYHTGKELLPLGNYDYVGYNPHGFKYRQGDNIYYYDENGLEINNDHN